MPRYKFRLLRSMSIDGSVRDVGALVNEAASWPNLRHYLNLEWIEKVPAAEDDPDAVEYPAAIIQTYAPAAPEPRQLIGEQEPAEGHESLPCRGRGCGQVNYLPVDRPWSASWRCWKCGEQQVRTAASGPGSGLVDVRCRNCRKRCYLPSDLLETTVWHCWSCLQPQSVIDTREHPAPVSMEEYAQSVDARFVTAEGDFKSDLTSEWRPRLGEAAAARSHR
jgi:hypothetical protein